MSRLAAAVVAAALAAACRDSPPAMPAQAPEPATPGRMRPLTSRDGAAPSGMLGPPQALPPGHPPVDGGSVVAPPVAGEAVSGTLTIAPKLRGRQGRALFIIARSSASGQILAVRKEEDVRFPRSFRISGADAMVEGTAFVGPFDVTARLSATADAMPAKGDVEGTARGIKAGAKAVTITLDSVRQ